MAQTTSVSIIPPFANHAMEFVLRSPVHMPISKTIPLITFTGRKSGKTFTTPVSYSQHGDQVYVFTHAAWWRNLRDRGSPPGGGAPAGHEARIMGLKRMAGSLGSVLGSALVVLLAPAVKPQGVFLIATILVVLVTLAAALGLKATAGSRAFGEQAESYPS